MSEPRAERLSLDTIVAYSLPLSGTTLVGIVMGMYFVKFATDVLLVAPAWMALLMLTSRIWDGVSDPAAGYLSDRTRSRWGRRRPWMALAAVPMGACVVMMWAPPSALTGLMLVAWIAAALLLFETAQTAFIVPYGALGVELTNDYHERTRLFGYRHMFAAAAPFAGLFAFRALAGADDQRGTAFVMSMVGGALLAGSVFYAVARLRERTEYQGRVSANPFTSFADVVRNPHARLLLFVFGVDTLGAAAILMLIPFFSQYVLLRDENLATAMLAAYLIPSFALTPIWIRISRLYSKKRLWMTSMTITIVGFFSQSFITVDTLYLAYVIPCFLGIGAGLGAVVAPAVMADVIDYDEYATGDRKEGSYLAVWNFTRKCASAVMPFLALNMLELSGYVPNAEQNETTVLVLRALVGVVPATFFAIGLLLFSRFAFNEREYREVRAELDRRAAADS